MADMQCTLAFWYKNKQSVKLCNHVSLIPYDDALLLCGGLRQAEGRVSYGINMSEGESNTTVNTSSKKYKKRTDIFKEPLNI